MTAATSGQTVKFHYTGKLDDGTVFDTSLQRGDPLEVTLGQGEIIKGVDDALQGMEPGQEKTVTLSPEEGYGPHRTELVQQVDRTAVPEHVDVSPGSRLAATDTSGKRLEVTVVASDDQKVTLDANHPLAGRDLTFELKLVDVNAA